MFIQVIAGKTSDAEGLRRQSDRWISDLKPGAPGWLGTTAGVGDNGIFVVMARFESEEAARRNSDRMEQGEWWAETTKYIDGDPHFHNCTDVDLLGDGGSDDAGFVQIVHGQAADKERMRALEQKMMDQFVSARPEFIGSVRGWEGNYFVEAAYFRSEAEARKGEQALAGAGLQDLMEQWHQAAGGPKFVDLKDPWLHSA